MVAVGILDSSAYDDAAPFCPEYADWTNRAGDG